MTETDSVAKHIHYHEEAIVRAFKVAQQLVWLNLLELTGVVNTGARLRQSRAADIQCGNPVIRWQAGQLETIAGHHGKGVGFFAAVTTDAQSTETAMPSTIMDA